MNRTAAFLILVGLTWQTATPVRANPAADAYAVATAHYQAGRWQMAIEEFQRCLARPDRADEQTITARFFLGEALVQTQQYESARNQYAEFLRRTPQHPFAARALFRIGESSRLNHDNAQAIQALRDFHELHPADPLNALALSYLGELALSAGDPDMARHWYEVALQQFPAGAASSDARLQLGMLNYQDGQYAEAATAFQTLTDDSSVRTQARYWLGMTQLAQHEFDSAAATFHTTATSDPFHALAPAGEYYSGEALRRAGHHVQALARYERVWKQWPASEWSAKSHRSAVQMALADGNYVRVEELAARFGQQFPDSPLRHEVRRALGRSLLKRQQYADAVEVFENLTSTRELESENRAESHPDTGWDWYLLSLSLLGEGRYADAFSAIERLQPVDDESDFADGARVARASALFGLNRFEEATVPYREYLASQPEGADAEKCRTELAVSLARLNRLDEAQQVLDELQFATSDQEPILSATLALADAAYASENTDLALPLFAALDRAGHLPQFVASGMLGTAGCLLLTDQPDEAIAILDRFLSRFPQHQRAADALLIRAKTLEKLQRFDEAAHAYHRFVDRYPEHPRVPDAMLDAARHEDRLDHKQQALELLQRMIEHHADHDRVDAALYLQAWLLAELDRPDDSAAAFARLHGQHRNSRFWADATYRLAERAASTSDQDRARQLLEEIIESDADDDVLAHALYLAGQIAATERRWNDVLPRMSRVNGEFPDSPLQLAAKYWSAEAHYRLGQFDRAEPLLRQVQNEGAGRQDEWLAMVPLRLAQVLAAEKHWMEAADTVSQMASRHPDFPQLYEADYLLGRCLAAQGRFAEARQAYRRVTESAGGGNSETAAMAQWMIGETYMHQAQYEQAIREYLRVETLHGYPRWNAGGLLQAGKCREMQGRRNEAMELYSKLLKHYPGTVFADEASQRLGGARLSKTPTAGISAGG